MKLIDKELHYKKTITSYCIEIDGKEYTISRLFENDADFDNYWDDIERLPTKPKLTDKQEEELAEIFNS